MPLTLPDHLNPVWNRNDGELPLENEKGERVDVFVWFSAIEMHAHDIGYTDAQIAADRKKAFFEVLNRLVNQASAAYDADPERPRGLELRGRILG